MSLWEVFFSQKSSEAVQQRNLNRKWKTSHHIFGALRSPLFTWEEWLGICVWNASAVSCFIAKHHQATACNVVVTGGAEEANTSSFNNKWGCRTQKRKPTVQTEGTKAVVIHTSNQQWNIWPITVSPHLIFHVRFKVNLLFCLCSQYLVVQIWMKNLNMMETFICGWL